MHCATYLEDALLAETVEVAAVGVILNLGLGLLDLRATRLVAVEDLLGFGGSRGAQGTVLALHAHLV